SSPILVQGQQWFRGSRQTRYWVIETEDLHQQDACAPEIRSSPPLVQWELETISDSIDADVPDSQLPVQESAGVLVPDSQPDSQLTELTGTVTRNLMQTPSIQAPARPAWISRLVYEETR
ncbi:hypothetical protein KXW37_001301, partial [Aspergillus fumigatus]